MSSGVADHVSNSCYENMVSHFKIVTDSGQVPGVVALMACDRQTVAPITSGWADVQNRVKMTHDNIFRIGSMTKPITAVATLKLIEEGVLALSDPIDRWLPEFSEMTVLRNCTGPIDDSVKAARPISVLDLLTHRSGLVYPFTFSGPLSEALLPLDTITDRRTEPHDWLAQLAALPLAFQPGTRFQYGLSYDVLGCLLARATGSNFEDLLRELIFDPLAMEDTSFSIPDSKLARLPVAYRQEEDGGIAVIDEPRGSMWRDPQRFQSGGGGLLSTANDYGRFASMLLNGGVLDGNQILQSGSVDTMTRNWLSTEQRQGEFFGRQFFAGQGYGLGVSVTDKPALQAKTVGFSNAGSFGWSGIYGTSWRADPAEGLNLIYLSQLQSTEMTVSQPAVFARHAYESLVSQKPVSRHAATPLTQ